MNSTGSGQLQFVTFDFKRSGKPLTMALNIQKVKEVVEANDLSLVPEGCTGILGIYDLRGCPVPVLAIRQLMADNENNLEDEYTRYVICELQKLWVAIPVQKTGRILSCSNSDFLPPPPSNSKDKIQMISGLIRKENAYIPVLNLDSILDSLMGASEDASAPVSLPHSPEVFSGKRVLVVDDSKIVIKKLTTLFESLGFKVATASDGEEALRRLGSSAVDFDLIFTDIEMPKMDGIEFAKKVKSTTSWQNIPIIFNSALSNPALIRDIEADKLGNYIVKFNPEEVIEIVARMLKTPESR